MQILFSAIQGDKLLIILQLSGCSKISQLVDNRPVVLDELHYVAWLQIPVDQVVVPLARNTLFSEFLLSEKIFSSHLRWFIPADR